MESLLCLIELKDVEEDAIITFQHSAAFIFPRQDLENTIKVKDILHPTVM